MPRCTFNVVCPGCKATNNVVGRVPTRNSKPKSYFTCAVCSSALEAFLHMSPDAKTRNLGIMVSVRIREMSAALQAMLIEEAQNAAAPIEEAAPA